MDEMAELAWKLLVELRSELKEAQKLRTQIIGVKIAFVTASLGFAFGTEGNPNYDLIVVPAIASVFFDYLIVSYSISIKRIGFYSRTYLEPKLRRAVSWPDHEPLWEEAMGLSEMRQHYSSLSNIGLSALVVAPAILHLLASKPLGNEGSALLSALLAIFFVFDILVVFCFKYTPREPLEWPRGDDVGQ